jgi:hypothetical protein
MSSRIPIAAQQYPKTASRVWVSLPSWGSSPVPEAFGSATAAVVDFHMLVHGRLISCNSVCVIQVLHIPYVVEQDDDGAWRASALLRPGVGAVGEGVTREEATDDLRAALRALLEVVGPPNQLTLTVNDA